jgi:hypothetical protein
MKFLADAHHRGVLRQEGPCYQFRHVQLQQLLASRPPRSRQLRPEHPARPGRQWLAPAKAAIPVAAAISVAAVVAASAVVAVGGRHAVHPGSDHEVTATPQSLTPYAVLSDRSNQSAADVAFSPDGREIAVADLNGAYLWNLATVHLIAVLNSPASQGIDAVAFSPHGRTLAAGGRDGSTYLWNLATGKLRTTFRCAGSGGISAVAFSPDGKTLAAAGSSDRGLTCVWDPATGARLARLTDGGGGIASVAFSPDGKTLAVGDRHGVTFLWKPSAARIAGQLNDPGRNGVGSVAFSPGGKSLAVGDSYGSTYLWNPASRQITAALPDPGRSGGVTAAAFSPDGTILAAADGDGSTYLWDLATGKLIAVFADLGSGGVSAAAFSPDGKTLATADRNGQTFLWKSPPTPTPTPGLTAQSEANAINRLLPQAAASRRELVNAVAEVSQCANLPGAVSQIQQSVNDRSAELSTAQGLPIGKLPDGATLKSDLVQALQYSLNADNGYLSWAEAQENGCVGGSPSNVTTDNDGATQYKNLFANIWNQQIASQYGESDANPNNM